MWTDPQWVQSGVDALRETLNVDGETKRRMVEFLRDEGFWDPTRQSWDSAIARFNACLDPSKSEYFKVAEVWALMRKFRRYHLLHAMAADCGFAPLCELPTEERRLRLLERIAAAQETIAGGMAELERLASPAPAQRIEAGVRTGGQFSQPGDSDTNHYPGGF